jgi:type II secretory pathway pseudopilin PulG
MYAILKNSRFSVTGRDNSPRRSAFSLTELLVVIAIIVLLIGLLLAALAQVRKRTLRTQTEATMQQFANACAVFQSEHGVYPGVIPDAVLNAHAAANAGEYPISSTENALLHLMGGYRLLRPTDALNTTSFIYTDYANYCTLPSETFEEIEFDGGPQHGQWKLKIRTVAADGGEVAQLGEGPFINGKPFAPYFTPDKNALVRLRGTGGASGQVTEHSDGFIPDLVDAWGQPLIYIRQSRERGPLVREPAPSTALPQFDLAGIAPFLKSVSIGESLVNQTFGTSNIAGSILGIGGTDGWNATDQQRKVMSVILNNPSFYKATPASAPFHGKARGAFLVLSAGPDGIYFSAVDGPGSRANPLTPASVDSDIIAVGPRVLEEFDDIRIYGGG